MNNNRSSQDITRNLIYLILFFVSSYLPAFEATDFFLERDITTARLSPNGDYIASLHSADGNQLLSLTHLNGTREINSIDLSELSEEKTVIHSISWLDNRNLAAQFTEINQGIKDLLDTRLTSYLVIFNFTPESLNNPDIYRVRTQGKLIDPLPDEEGQFLYSKIGLSSKIYRLSVSKLNKIEQKLGKLDRVDGGQFIKENEIISVNSYVTRWFLDSDGNPKAALTVDRNSKLSLLSLEGDEHTEIHSWQSSEETEFDSVVPEKRLLPIALAHDEHSYYCLDFAEEEERSLYKVNYETKEEELIYETSSFKILDIILSKEDSSLIGIRVINEGDIENVYLNSELNSQLTKDNQQYRMIDVALSESNDKGLVLRYVEEHNRPGKYLLLDQKSGEVSHIGSTYPHLNNLPENRLIEDWINVEGLDIPYLLTLPAIDLPAPYPLLVVPHGGPIGVFDHRYFDLETQFFATNGYAVLRINYRGSSGYSQELQEAGTGEWGGLILEDIYQATLSTQERTDIGDACIYGSSYGGYAAMMLAILHPEIYQCAASNAGVSDLNLYLNSSHMSDRQRLWAADKIGNSLTDYDYLKSISPIYSIANLNRPIFISHGALDEVVDVEHAYRLKKMLDKLDKDYQWEIYPDTGHSYESNTARADHITKVKEFLDTHLLNNF